MRDRAPAGVQVRNALVVDIEAKDGLADVMKA